jgi:hypothetical protein
MEPGKEPERQIVWWGRIVELVYRGAHRSVILEAGEARMHVEAPAFQRIEAGAQVALVVQPGGAWAMRP